MPAPLCPPRPTCTSVYGKVTAGGTTTSNFSRIESTATQKAGSQWPRNRRVRHPLVRRRVIAERDMRRYAACLASGQHSLHRDGSTKVLRSGTARPPARVVRLVGPLPRRVHLTRLVRRHKRLADAVTVHVEGGHDSHAPAREAASRISSFRGWGSPRSNEIATAPHPLPRQQGEGV